MNTHEKFSAIKNYFFMLKKIAKLSPSYVVLSLISSILSNIPSIANIIVLQVIINELNKLNPSTHIILIALFIFLAYTLLFSATSLFLTTIKLPTLQQLISLKLRKEIYQIAQSVPLEEYDNPEFLNTLTITLQEADGQSLGVIDSFTTLISNLLSIGLLISLIISVEPLLIMLSLLSAIITFIYGLKSSSIQATYIEKTAPITRKNSFIQQVFTQKCYSQELRINNASLLFLTHLNTNIHNLISILTSRGKKTFSFCLQSTFINTLILSINIGLLSWNAINNNIAIGNIFAALSSSQQLTDQLSIFSKHFTQIYQHGLIIEKYRTFFRLFEPKKNCVAYPRLAFEHPTIELNNVSFRYTHTDKNVLNNVTLKISHGEHIAIVGPNGSGKSTLARIIAGLYPPNNGDILINGVPYHTYSSEQIFQLYSFVFQDFRIAPLSIAENILMLPFTDTSACRAQIDDALTFSQLKDKITLLPNGILTELTKEFSENGTILSGGELQKLAIARAYAQDKPIIIFDEATSALDAATEKQFIRDTLNLFSTKTIVWVTHRPECLKFVDKIYFIKRKSGLWNTFGQNIRMPLVWFLHINTTKNYSTYAMTGILWVQNIVILYVKIMLHAFVCTVALAPTVLILIL